MFELLDASARAAHGEGENRDDFETWLRSPRIDPERDIRVLEQDGRLVGYVDIDPVGEDPVRWWSETRVHPVADPGTVLPQLVAWAEERAAGDLLRLWGPDEDTERREIFERLGFPRSRLSYRMVIELDEEPGAANWPEGVELRTFATGEERVVFEAHTEVWEDTWEPLDEPYEEWTSWTVGRASFDPSLWFLAWDGAELAGFALCRQDEVSPDRGWVSVLGVRRPWRRRGLGEALLRHAFAEFRRRGYARVGLGVDAGSPTGATRLYERAGMRIYRVTAFYEKEIPAAQ